MPRIKLELTDDPAPAPATRVRATKDQTKLLRASHELYSSSRLEDRKALLLKLSEQTGLSVLSNVTIFYAFYDDDNVSFISHSTMKWIGSWFTRQKQAESIRQQKHKADILQFKTEYSDSTVPHVKTSVASLGSSTSSVFKVKTESMDTVIDLTAPSPDPTQNPLPPIPVQNHGQFFSQTRLVVLSRTQLTQTTKSLWFQYLI
jgi:hypothetical protein